jgi:hypothetical protein
MHKRKPHLNLIIGLNLITALLLPRTALASGVIELLEAEVNGYQVSLGFISEIKRGQNEIHLEIQDLEGLPAMPEDVRIGAVFAEEEEEHAEESHNAGPAADHANMPGMEMDSQPAAQTEHDMSGSSHEELHLTVLEHGTEPGEFTGTLEFEKSGAWLVVVHFDTGEETLKVEFPIRVAGGYSRAGILAGILGLNMAIVSSAAITKRTSAKPSS